MGGQLKAMRACESPLRTGPACRVLSTRSPTSLLQAGHELLLLCDSDAGARQVGGGSGAHLGWAPAARQARHEPTRLAALTASDPLSFCPCIDPATAGAASRLPWGAHPRRRDQPGAPARGASGCLVMLESRPLTPVSCTLATCAMQARCPLSTHTQRPTDRLQ